MTQATTSTLSAVTETDRRASRYVTGVYVQMMMGVAVTALVAYALVASGVMMMLATQGGSAFTWGVFLLQIGTVLMFGPMMQRASLPAVKGLFFFYAAITGVTVGYAGLVYQLGTMMSVFLVASMAFGGLAMFGYVTKRNLGVVGTFCMQALWMVIGMSLLYAVGSMFPAASAYMPALNITTGLIGTVVFAGLTAYESQRLRETAYSLAANGSTERSLGIYTTAGALTMYLNFVNLFFSLLRLTGGGGKR